MFDIYWYISYTNHVTVEKLAGEVTIMISKKERKQAFTMAEILISLTIIGVIAAITLPSLRANINEKTWAAQRKALYSRMSQAIAMLSSLNGYGLAQNNDGTPDYATINEKATMTFVTEGLNKVLKIENICDADNLKKCGIADKISTLKGNKIDFPTKLSELNPLFLFNYNPQKYINTNAVAFEMKSGGSLAVFYNPLCQADMGNSSYYVQIKMCANFIYDLNGIKGPNKIGKDINFITAIYSTDSEVVAPIPLESTTSSFGHVSASHACKSKDNDRRVPNTSELMSMFYNKDLLDMGTDRYWASLSKSGDGRWHLKFDSGTLQIRNGNVNANVRCIKR